MAKKISKKKASSISFAMFIIGLGIIFFTGYWWPGMMLVIGVPLAARQYLIGRLYDMAISLFVFLGGFITIEFQIPWKYLLPSLFTVGGLYLLFKELFFSESTESAEEEDLNKEFEEKE